MREVFGSKRIAIFLSYLVGIGSCAGVYLGSMLLLHSLDLSFLLSSRGADSALPLVLIIVSIGVGVRMSIAVWEGSFSYGLKLSERLGFRAIFVGSIVFGLGSGIANSLTARMESWGGALGFIFLHALVLVLAGVAVLFFTGWGKRWLGDSKASSSQAPQLSVSQYRDAAAQGDAQAQCILGDMYSSGHAVAKDAKKAFKWYQLAAEQGCARSQFNLGVMYENSWGVKGDYVQAQMWINLAAAQGYDSAVKARDHLLGRGMTLAEFGLAHKLAKFCKASGYKYYG